MSAFTATDIDYIAPPQAAVIAAYANAGDVMEVGRLVIETMKANRADRVEVEQLAKLLFQDCPKPDFPHEARAVTGGQEAP